MRKIVLENWTVAGFWPYTPIFGKSMETGFSMSGCTPSIPASVPGSIHNDLLRAGLIEDPYYEQNSLKCEWVSNRWWVYENHFPYQKPAAGRTELVFKGIDYKAYIYLNGQRIAEHTGMYTECRIDVTHLLQEQNFLMVILESAPQEMGQIGHTSQTHTQKARFGYKWDYCVRLVDLGLYDEVYLVEKGVTSIQHPHIRVLDARQGKVSIQSTLLAGQDCSAQCTASVTFEGQEVARQTQQLQLKQGENNCAFTLDIAQPQLWYPNGYGAQPLYEVHLTLEDPEGSDCYRSNLGLRDLTYEQCEGAADGSLPYVVRINGQRIYLKGGNITPLDMMYGRVTREDYDKLLRQMKRAHFNIVRVWGGGLIEKEDFYDLCDRYGILVWQEFIQSSSGIDNIPSKRPEFLDLLSKTAHAAVFGRRNHPSLAYWSGGNELMGKENTPSTYEDENIAMLKKICDQYDPDHLMLPTSASGPREFLAPDQSGLNHDVHGPWLYDGIENHYTLFNLSDSQLHSEFGCNGMSNADTIRKICSQENQGVFDNENFTWRHHGEWWNALWRDIDVIGQPKDLEQYVTIDQFIQGEAIRYAVEANSRRAFQNCGSIIWAFCEPFPNTANTSLVDYYGGEKLAYYMVGEAFAPVHCSMRYSSLKFQPGDRFQAQLFAHNDLSEAADFTLEVSVEECGGGPLLKESYHGQVASGGRQALGELSFQTGQNPFVVRLCYSAAGQTRENQYLFLPHAEDRTQTIAAVEAFCAKVKDWALAEKN